MWSDGIVPPPPLLDEDDSLGQCVEDFSVQELVPQLAVEALVVAVLPRTSGLDVERLPNLSGHHDGEKASLTGNNRLSNLERWVEDALALERDGIDLLLGTQSPLGELLASPQAIELAGIAPCLLDCHDFTRRRRLVARGLDPRWPMGMDTFCWAVFHRLHARDPQWEQRVLHGYEHDGSIWSRWGDWQHGDPRWKVFIHDHTHEQLKTTIETVASCIESTRAGRAPLMKEDEWWL